MRNIQCCAFRQRLRKMLHLGLPMANQDSLSSTSSHLLFLRWCAYYLLCWNIPAKWTELQEAQWEVTILLWDHCWRFWGNLCSLLPASVVVLVPHETVYVEYGFIQCFSNCGLYNTGIRITERMYLFKMWILRLPRGFGGSAALKLYLTNMPDKAYAY